MAESISLPPPRERGPLTLEECLRRRRSVRHFRPEPLNLGQIGLLFWSAQGFRSLEGRRTAPSAGALYPLEVYGVTPEHVLHYLPAHHTAEVTLEGDIRKDLCRASLDQEFILEAPFTLVIAAVYQRIEVKYGSRRGPRYVHFEVGHAAQNVHLEAVALGLGSVPVGAFHDERVAEVMKLPDDHRPLYLIPIGPPAWR